MKDTDPFAKMSPAKKFMWESAVQEQAALNHAIYKRVLSDSGESQHFEMVAISSDLTTQEAEIWRKSVTIDPLPFADENRSRAVGVFYGPDGDFILAEAYHPDGNQEQTNYHYVLLPRDIWLMMAVNIKALFEITRKPLFTEGEDLPALRIPSAPTWTIDKRASLLDSLRNSLGKGEISPLLALLGAALSDQRLTITSYSDNLEDRLELIQTLLLLLPSPARQTLTFTTHTAEYNSTRTRIIFSSATEIPEEEHRIIAPSGHLELTEELQAQPYIQCLNTLWRGDMDTFVAELRALDLTAAQYMNGGKVFDGLTTIAARHLLDLQVLNDEDIPAGRLIETLRETPPPPGDLRIQYAKQLIDYALNDRNPDAAVLVTRLMDEDTHLGRVLTDILNETLETEPDAVYFVARTHLAQGIVPNWLPILHTAAKEALRLIIEEEDHEILIEWLRLIAREPSSYELGSILREGIHAAQKHTYTDGELGQQLLVFTARRTPDLLDSLLDDAEFLANLAEPNGPAFRDYEPAATAATISAVRELALVLLGRAVIHATTRPEAAAVFTVNHVEFLWDQIFSNEPNTGLPERYSPEHIIQILATDGVQWMPNDVLQFLLSQLAAAEDTTLYRKMVNSLAAENRLFSISIPALQQSGLPAAELIERIEFLKEHLEHQQIVDIYIRMLEFNNWQDIAAQRYVEELTRFIQKNREVNIAQNHLWRMLWIAVENDVDLATRVISRRLLVYIGEIEDDNGFIQALQEIHKAAQHNAVAKVQLFNWLREFVQTQPPKRLHQLNQLLEGNKALVEAQAIIDTSIAMKKTLNKRSMEEFAEAINTAFNVLQTLSDSFDPVNRQSINFDAQTVHTELEHQEADLSTFERSVLAKNLKELAHLITTLADNRSKSNIIRREEDIERQLLANEQPPQSAIDAMKWLSGYLGSQNDKE